jgi:hypothetical protein
VGHAQVVQGHEDAEVVGVRPWSASIRAQRRRNSAPRLDAEALAAVIGAWRAGRDNHRDHHDRRRAVAVDGSTRRARDDRQVHLLAARGPGGVVLFSSLEGAGTGVAAREADVIATVDKATLPDQLGERRPAESLLTSPRASRAASD